LTPKPEFVKWEIEVTPMPTEADPIFITVSPSAEGVDVGARTLASAIYARLRADILSCRCRPGEKLLIGPLGRRFNVSIASVREALSRLVADGLVVAEDQRGFRVSSVSLADLRDVTGTRIELECLALRRSIAQGDAAWIKTVEGAWQALESVPRQMPEDGRRHHEMWSLMHGRFHSALVSACGLDWLLRFRATLYEQSERYRRLGLTVTHATRDTEGEHRGLFEATIRRDADTAAALLSEHFQRTANSIAEAYRERELNEAAAATKPVIQRRARHS
jgi:DNA-binding GntR family transcriptional regulator